MQPKTHSGPSYKSAMAHTHSVYTLLLSTFITVCVSGSDLTVLQSPKIINATEGQTVNITCSFTSNSTAEELKLMWLRNNNRVYHQQLYNISALRSQNFNRPVTQTSVLHLSPVQLNDSGTYHCKVWYDKPMLCEKITEQSTELRVEPAPVVLSLAPAHTFTIPVMGASAFGLVLMTACIPSVLFMKYKRRRKRPKAEGEGLPAQVEDEASVLYAALNILKPEDKKNTQETQQELNQNTLDCSAENVVLYSGVCLKPQNQKQTALSDLS